MTPTIKYNIYETQEYFEKQTDKIKKHLTKMVKGNKMSKETARKKLDMHYSMLIYLGVCVKWAEDEKYLNDNNFSFHALYAETEQNSKGDKKLRDAVKNL